MLVDHFALPVHHVVELEHLLADLKVVVSTLRWAFSIARVIWLCSMGWSSAQPSRSMMPAIRCEPNRRIRSSSSET